MRTESTPLNDATQLAELRQREKQILRRPSAESFLELADAYHGLGLVKESDRLMQLAESYENAGLSPASGLLSGAADPVMLIEVIQILSRTKSTGDFVIDTQAETFHLFFEHGQIINASSQNDAPGMPSFRRALRVANGSYRFVQLPARNLPRLIEGGTEILLLDAMHEEDTGAAVKRKHDL